MVATAKSRAVLRKQSIKQLSKEEESTLNFHNMKTRTLIIALTLITGLFTACTDNKKTEENLGTEIISEETKTSVEDNVEDAEERRG